MATKLHIGLKAKVLAQDSVSEEGKPLRWLAAPVTAAKAAESDEFYTVPVQHNMRRVILATHGTAKAGTVIAVRNTSPLHTVRISPRVRKGKSWGPGGVARFIGPNGIGDVYLDDANSAVVEEMPS